MADVFIDLSAAVNGDGTSESTPFNVMPTLGANTYKFAAGTSYVGTLTVTAHGCEIQTYGDGDPFHVDGNGGAYGINAAGYVTRVLGVKVTNAASLIRLTSSNSYVRYCVLKDGLDGASGDAGVNFSPSANARTNVQIEGNIISNVRAGVYIRHTHATPTTWSDWSISDNTITDARIGGGITVLAGWPSKTALNVFSGLTVARNTVTTCANAGISVLGQDPDVPNFPTAYCTGVVIEGNTVSYCGQGGIKAQSLQLSYIKGQNHVFMCGIGTDEATDTLGGIWTAKCDRLVVSDNNVHDIYTPGIDGVGIFIDQESVDCKVLRNRVADCFGLSTKVYSGMGIATYNADATEITSNVVLRCRIGIATYGATGRAIDGSVTHNTVKDSATWGILTGLNDGTDNPSGYTYKNNLVAGSNTSGTLGREGMQVSAGVTSLTTSHNWFDSVDFKVGAVDASDTVGQDPMITPGGSPLPGSPLLTQGADLGYIRDIRGFQSRKHIGAYGAARLRATEHN